MPRSLIRSPIYRQLNDRLRALMLAGYAQGDRFLTEREVVDRFEVSRPTANKALAGLVAEGLLEFRPGVGTFVRCDPMDYDLRALVSFTNKAKAAGKKPATKLLEFREIAAGDVDAEVTAALGVEPGALLWELLRLRLADGVPVILEHRYVVQAMCPKLTKAQAAGSLYGAWTDQHGLVISGADEVISAVSLKGKESERLEVARGTPAFEVVGIGRVEDERPLWWERTLYRGDQYLFHSRLGPVQGAAVPTRGMLRSGAGTNGNGESRSAS